jgi:hypothetical protein
MATIIFERSDDPARQEIRKPRLELTGISTRTLSAQPDRNPGLRLELLQQIGLMRARQIHVDVLFRAAPIAVENPK